MDFIKGRNFMGLFVAICLLVIVFCVGISLGWIEGDHLDRSYKICRNHGTLKSVNVHASTVTCTDGTVKAFILDSR